LRRWLLMALPRCVGKLTQPWKRRGLHNQPGETASICRRQPTLPLTSELQPSGQHLFESHPGVYKLISSETNLLESKIAQIYSELQSTR
jgi:hypothetical protein